MSPFFDSTYPVRRHPIVVNSQPGGRFPGVELPPTWFGEAGPEARVVPSILPQAGNRGAILTVVRATCLAIRDHALALLHEGRHPQLIGGDHSLAMGSLSATTRRFGRVGVIWIDAHADFNTADTSPSGNPHGMPLAAACGLGDERLTGLFGTHVRPSDVVLIAAREIDPGERELLGRHGVWCVSVPDLRSMGAEALAQAVAERLAGLPVHLSFDFDSLDEAHFAATGTPSSGGLTPDEAEALLRGLAARLPIVASDWVEFDPRHAHADVSAAHAARLHRAFGEALDAARGPRGGSDQAASCA
ncbi:MAG: arginase family protein [Candidatus Sericytochromatia bacterium]|nr:arginase family protein [Candidatus Sericytochromatia bacterium]